MRFICVDSNHERGTVTYEIQGKGPDNGKRILLFPNTDQEEPPWILCSLDIENQEVVSVAFRNYLWKSWNDTVLYLMRTQSLSMPEAQRKYLWKEPVVSIGIPINTSSGQECVKSTGMMEY